MGLAEASSSTIFAGKSTTEGTEPTTYQELKTTSHELEMSAGSFEGEDIDPSRKPVDIFRTTKAGQGDLSAHWRPGDLDALVETALAGAFGSALAVTDTVSFSVAAADSEQTIDDDDSGAAFANVSVGDLVLIANAVNAANNGLRIVTAKASDNQITVYNPGGVAEAATIGVTFDNNGTATIGATKIFHWIERLFSDGTNNIYSELYQDLLINTLNLVLAQSAPTRLNLNFQGDPPTLVHADGAAPITKQRGGSDVSATTERLVHSMDDIQELILFSDTDGPIIFAEHADATKCLLTNWQCTLENNLRQDTAIGCADIINTALGRSRLTGQFNAYMNAVAQQTTNVIRYLKDNPDDLKMFLVMGRNDATSYGFYFDTVRFQGAPAPVPGNDQAVTINAQFSGLDLRVTRI